MSHATSPFKFLDSYQQDDLDIFFGREKETDALYDALSGVKHLLVYGPSGAGKTSLIECGLRNQFSDADWFAVSIRRGSNMTASVFASINEALPPVPTDGVTSSHPVSKPANRFDDFGPAIEQLFAERYQPVYLLFDQFEELLILGDEAEKKDFFTRLNRLIRYKVPCRVMLVMREEFIGHLSEFEPLCPSIFQHRFRLEKMGRSNVQSVIQQILEAEKYQSDFRVEQPAALAKSILAKLPDTQREIELAHVQVFLEELWDRATAENKRQKPTLHSGLVQENDNLERVLDGFLKKQLEQLKRSHGEKVPLELLAAMISERHTKLQLGAGDLENALAKNGVVLQKPLPDLLRDLEQRRIIRTLKSGEQTQFEISHDVLALVVGQNLTDEMKLREKAREIYRVYEGRAGMFSREDLNYLRAFKDYLGYSEELGRRIEESEGYLREEQARELEATERRIEFERNLRGEAEGAKIDAEAALEKANKLINAFYYYEDKFALAYGVLREESEIVSISRRVFYFIDKNGDEVTQLGRWEKAEQFEWPGLAKVKAWQNDKLTDYLLNTEGSIHQVAFSIRDLNVEVTALDLSGKQLTAAPYKVFKHTLLRVLLLNSNKLRHLPKAIGNLTNLTRLDLGYNYLGKSSPALRLLRQIQHSLYGSQSGDWASAIGKLKNLIHLDLRNNQLGSLPVGIIALKNLRELDLSQNDLDSLPVGIAQLTNLTRLQLKDNELSTLPAEIGQLKNLTTLDLTGNKLNSLPIEVAQLKNLMHLGLEGNPISEAEKEKIRQLLPGCEIEFPDPSREYFNAGAKWIHDILER